MTVRVASVQRAVPEQVFGLGTVGADVRSAVGFKVAGVINEIDANEGDHVKTGQLLARLDSRDVVAQLAVDKAAVAQARAAIGKADADVASAEAALTNAIAIARRRQAIVKQGLVSIEEAQSDLAAEQGARANLRAARAEVKTAQAALIGAVAAAASEEATLSYYTLRAPYDAWVLARNLNLGAMPVPGQAVFTLVEPSTIWVVGYVDERLAGSVRVGQKAEIALRSQPGRRFAGHVARIEIQSNAVNEERLVDVDFDKLPAHIHLAEQAEIYIDTGLLLRTVTVPQTAVTELADGQGSVWTVEQGRLRKRVVIFGPALLNGSLPVISGLPPGARVVIGPIAGLRIGHAVIVATGSTP
jgi:HlyD family secretion protein